MSLCDFTGGAEGAWPARTSLHVNAAAQFTATLELSGTFSILFIVEGNSARAACGIP